MSDDALIPDVAGEGGRTKRPPPTGTVRAGEVAKSFNVTPQCVADWVGDGLPVAFTNEHGWRYFEPASVRRWVSANRPRAIARQGGGGHGGQREGSGRKSWRGRASASTSQGRGGMDTAPLLEHREDEEATQGADAPAKAGVESLLTQENRRLKSAQARKHELDVLERERVLVKVSEVEEAIGEAARNVRVRLETMAARLTGQMLTAMKLGPEHGPAIQDLVQTACDEVLAELVENPLGTSEITRVAA